MEDFDALVVGGGPAGSTCARFLATGGLRVAVLDRARFPRVKLCAGWVSLPIWDVLELRPVDYPLGLWPWEKCHVYYHGRHHVVRARGHFIRRFELDDFLLARSGARVIEHAVRDVAREADGTWVVDGRFRARFLVGAGGTHCPVARARFPRKPAAPVGAQELETEADPRALAACRPGADGEPALLLHDDLRGYSWNVPKTDWVNIGSGTVQPREVRAAWAHARDFFTGAGQLPADVAARLDEARGHSYHLFRPAHLAAAEQDGALLVGDALGLAQPLTAEGILPAVLSGRLAAEAIRDGRPSAYPERLARHPVLADYAAVFHLREAAGALRARRSNGAAAPARRRLAGKLADAATARGFAWMFSGRPLPAGRWLGVLAAALARNGRRGDDADHDHAA